MGISYLNARMMWNAKQSGVDFGHVLTLGHLSLRLFPSELAYFRRIYQRENGIVDTPLDGYRWEDYVDDFLRDFLGAKSITVLDASSYQGAETIHDMNIPVPTAWHGKYDVVVDGGSLEHIFNVPTSFANLANMLTVGGTLFVSSPANNLMGHGFYQFSPEFMFRVFSESNGFEIQNVMLYEAGYPGVELTKNTTVYKVVDPDAVRQRVGLVNTKPVMMLVEAKKVRSAEIFLDPPQQSDYVTKWNAASEAGAEVHWRRRAKGVFQRLPISVRAPIQGFREKRIASLKNEDLYTREEWPPTDLQ